MNHIHIGPGKLALGLIVPQIRNANYVEKTLLIARSKGKAYYDALRKIHGYKLNILESKTLLEVKPVDLFWGDEVDHSLISDPQTIILTTAVGEKNLPLIASNITAGLQQRKQRCKNNDLLFVIACENIPNNSKYLRDLILKNSPELRDFLLRNVIFLNTIVDRICPEEPKLLNDEVILETESYQSWIVEAPSSVGNKKSLLQDILGKEVMIVSKEEFDFYEKRKLWLINGIHIVVSIYGLLENELENILYGSHKYIRTISQALSNPQVLERVTTVQEAFALGLDEYYKEKVPEERPPEADLNQIEKFNRTVIKRFQLTGVKDDLIRPIRDVLTPDIIDEAISQATAKAVKELKEKAVQENLNSVDNLRRFFENEAYTVIYQATLAVAKQMNLFPFASKIAERIVEPLRYAFRAMFKPKLEYDDKAIQKFLLLSELPLNVLTIIKKYLAGPNKYLTRG